MKTEQLGHQYFPSVGVLRKLQGPCLEMTTTSYGLDCHNRLWLAAYKVSARLVRAAYTVSASLASQGQKKLKRSLGSELTLIRAATI